MTTSTLSESLAAKCRTQRAWGGEGPGRQSVAPAAERDALRADTREHRLGADAQVAERARVVLIRSPRRRADRAHKHTHVLCVWVRGFCSKASYYCAGSPSSDFVRPTLHCCKRSVFFFHCLLLPPSVTVIVKPRLSSMTMTLVPRNSLWLPPRLRNCWPNSGQLWSKSPLGLGRCMRVPARNGQTRPTSERAPPEFARRSPKKARSGPSWADVGRRWPDFGPLLVRWPAGRKPFAFESCGALPLASAACATGAARGGHMKEQRRAVESALRGTGRHARVCGRERGPRRRKEGGCAQAGGREQLAPALASQEIV